MVKVSIVVATQEHIDTMKGSLRESDERACWVTAHYTANEGLQSSFDISDLCWVALVDGVPVACCGVGRRTMLSLRGIPWLLATNDIRKAGLKIVRHSRFLIRQMLDKFDFLETWVDARNKVSITWLKWCNFKLEEAEPIGLDGQLFHRCWMEKGVI